MLLALPMGGVSAATATGNKMSDWTAKVGGISAVSGGVFQINAFDQSTAASQVNQKGARQAMFNEAFKSAKISITLDTASILAKRSPLASNPGGGSNDTGIIFGGTGIKASTKATVNAIEAETQYYVLMFSNDALSINLVDKNNYVMKDVDNDPTTGEDGKEARVHQPWAGQIKDKADNSNLYVNLAAKYTTVWDAAKAAGKVEVTLLASADGSVKVWVNGTHIKELDGAAGTCKPFGGEIGVRAGMGFHVPTKILAANIEKYTATGDSIDEWTAKRGSISSISGGVFQINAHDKSIATDNVTNPSFTRIAMWYEDINEGKASITLDYASITARRAPYGCSNPSGGSNDTGIIFGGTGIKAYTGTGDANAIENVSQYYFLYFSNSSLKLAMVNKDNYVMKDVDNDPTTGEGGKEARVQQSWVGIIKDKADNSTLNVNLDSKYKTVWEAAAAAGKITLSLTWSKDGSVKVLVNGTHIKELDGAAGTAVPFGGEFGVRAGMGYHVPTKVLDADIKDYTPNGNSVDEWSAKIGQISSIDGGLFQINAWDESQATNKTLNPKHSRLAMWYGNLNSGKVSVTLDYASIKAGRGDGKAGANDSGIVFGGSGIKAYTGGGDMNAMENASQYYFLYFSNSNLQLALVNKDNYIDKDGDPNTGTNGKEAQKAWVGVINDKADNSALRVDLNAKYADLWKAAEKSGKIKLTVGWTEKGEVRVWVNDTHITELDGAKGTAVPFGGEVGVRCGMGWHVPTKVYAASVKYTTSPLTGDVTFFVGAGVVLLSIIGAAVIVGKKKRRVA